MWANSFADWVREARVTAIVSDLLLHAEEDLVPGAQGGHLAGACSIPSSPPVLLEFHSAAPSAPNPRHPYLVGAEWGGGGGTTWRPTWGHIPHVGQRDILPDVNPGVDRPGISLGSPWWRASSIIAQPPWPLCVRLEHADRAGTKWQGGGGDGKSPRKTRLTSGIVRHDSDMRKSGSDPERQSGGTRQGSLAAVAESYPEPEVHPPFIQITNRFPRERYANTTASRKTSVHLGKSSLKEVVSQTRETPGAQPIGQLSMTTASIVPRNAASRRAPTSSCLAPATRAERELVEKYRRGKKLLILRTSFANERLVIYLLADSLATSLVPKAWRSQSREICYACHQQNHLSVPVNKLLQWHAALYEADTHYPPPLQHSLSHFSPPGSHNVPHRMLLGRLYLATAAAHASNMTFTSFANQRLVPHSPGGCTDNKGIFRSTQAANQTQGSFPESRAANRRMGTSTSKSRELTRRIECEYTRERSGSFKTFRAGKSGNIGTEIRNRLVRRKGVVFAVCERRAACWNKHSRPFRTSLAIWLLRRNLAIRDSLDGVACFHGRPASLVLAMCGPGGGRQPILLTYAKAKQRLLPLIPGLVTELYLRENELRSVYFKRAKSHLLGVSPGELHLRMLAARLCVVQHQGGTLVNERYRTLDCRMNATWIIVVSLFAYRQGKPGPIPGRFTGFSQVGIVLNYAVGRRVFSGISHLPIRFNPAPLHTHLNHPHRLSKHRAQLNSEDPDLSPSLLLCSKIRNPHPYNSTRRSHGKAQNIFKSYRSSGNPTQRVAGAHLLVNSLIGYGQTRYVQRLSSEDLCGGVVEGESDSTSGWRSLAGQLFDRLRADQWRGNPTQRVAGAHLLVNSLIGYGQTRYVQRLSSEDLCGGVVEGESDSTSGWRALAGQLFDRLRADQVCSTSFFRRPLRRGSGGGIRLNEWLALTCWSTL
ncbi:hypothetical protein PR048_002800 [Dryococelus australis]|uniref:Uncharacterized protein n=1 Tax=Dryococelus australis TaxID=614101 RepID=A0ABQ9IL96_9NEOP|nr:hypothetical protein PR048_002800 [Dryococelus australis]